MLELMDHLVGGWFFFRKYALLAIFNSETLKGHP